METPILYNVNGACAALNVSRTTLYALMQRGAIKWVQMGTQRRIPAEEVQRIASEGVSVIRSK